VPGYQELQLLGQVLNFLEELLREKVVCKEVGLNDADEDQELEKSRAEIVVEWLPLFALVLFL
jgi:hypothetical protein